MSAWHSTRSAPADQIVLVWSEDRCWVAWLSTEYDPGGQWLIDGEGTIEPPLFWMPLPGGPK